MSTVDAANLMIAAAQELLNRFTCLDRFPEDQIPSNTLTRQALAIVVNHSDYQIFGICADTADQAAIALKTYLAALGYDDKPEITHLEGPVYIKFNPKTGLCHTAPYVGTHRGVLVSCQSAYDGDVNNTFGHLPLDLFSSEV